MSKRDNVVFFFRWKWAVCMVVLAAAAFPASLSGQEARAAAASPLAVSTPPPEPDDPAYDLYREGYAFVLSEQWDKARAKFAELRKRFPSSAYLDDAAYWTAVSWRRIDREKAAKLYRALLREFPQSPYMDDAVADLRLLEVEAELARTTEQDQLLKEQQEIRVGLSRELEYLQQDLQRLQEAQHIKFRNRWKVIGDGDTL
ncbi:MAG: tetratricopeptide repeat protein, partial [Bacteroidetes bacterium]|nr:tetratricopeptide repeat protein [Bacteroidota bacterium]